jgi:hypothetical protein
MSTSRRPCDVRAPVDDAVEKLRVDAVSRGDLEASPEIFGVACFVADGPGSGFQCERSEGVGEHNGGAENVADRGCARAPTSYGAPRSSGFRHRSRL